nr:acidic fibroblast growth factor intracellular [Hymenolepis microstoma]
MSDYGYLKSIIRLPQSYSYGLKIGFPPGTIGSELLPIVSPPSTGPMRIKPWLKKRRHKWFREFSTEKDLEEMCIKGNQYWLTCVFRWMHFLDQQKIFNEIQNTRNLEFKAALQQAIPSPDLFRMEYILNFCHFRRVHQIYSNNIFIIPDPFGMCPRVCDERSGALRESEEENMKKGGLLKLGTRALQCEFADDHPNFLSSVCTPDSRVGLHTTISYSCSCPASDRYSWMEGPKACSLHSDWRASGYLAESVATYITHSSSWRFEPPSYYKNLQCSREGTLDIGYICLDGKGQPIKGFLSPHCRKAEYCICKPMYYGASCGQRKNPCEQPIGNKPSGDVACRVTDGNKCIPDLVSSSYSCQCLPSFRRFDYKEGPMAGQDNCAELINVCLATKCHHGKCISASERDPETGKMAIIGKCICGRGWRGRFCSQPYPINNWTPWTSWSACEPSCQNGLYEGGRYRYRKRMCIDPYHEDCQFTELVSGNRIKKYRNPLVVERRICRPRPCDRYLRLAAESIERAPPEAIAVTFQTMHMIESALGLLCIFLLLVASVAFWSVWMQNKRASKMAKETFMKIQAALKRRENF